MGLGSARLTGRDDAVALQHPCCAVKGPKIKYHLLHLPRAFGHFHGKLKFHDCDIMPILNPKQLSVTTVRMFLLFPSIIHRLESYLVADEFCGVVGVQVTPGLALEAVTKDSDNTEEHGAEIVNFRSGMGQNYERLEFIGDCFLKMATGIALFAQDRHDDEFHMHCSRMAMVCNKNLLNNALKAEYFRFVRSEAFSR